MTFARQLGVHTGRSCGIIEMADGHTSKEPSRVTKTATLKIGRHKEPVQLTTAPLKDSYDVLLGIPWLQDHDPAISWSGKELILRCGGRQVVVPAVKIGDQQGKSKQCEASRARRPAIQLVCVQKMTNELKCKGTEAILYVLRESASTPAMLQNITTRTNGIQEAGTGVLAEGIHSSLPLSLMGHPSYSPVRKTVNLGCVLITGP